MNEINVNNRAIFCRDNLDILRGINSGCIDLIYLDPPFNKKRVFTAPIGSAAEGASFSDIFGLEDIKDEWVDSIRADNESLYELLDYAKKSQSSKKKYNFCYLAYMSVRIIEMHRVLKDTGSIYLHCDSTMSHYLKLMMDCIFGEDNFRNEIIWHYRGTGQSSHKFPCKHDNILFYAKSKKQIFNKQYIKAAKVSGWTGSDKKLADANWGDINTVFQSKERKHRTAYPTQKPVALLERIIKASTNNPTGKKLGGGGRHSIGSVLWMCYNLCCCREARQEMDRYRYQ